VSEERQVHGRERVEEMNDLERLVAIEEIKQLKARYFRCVDTKDWDGLMFVFAPDAEMRTDAGTDADVVSTAQAIVDLIRSLTSTLTTVHHGHTPEITIESSSLARGIWAMEDVVRWPEDTPGTGMHGFGYYEEEYIKSDSRWQISKVELKRLLVDFE
jgi:hypothetical protein